jgi:hypothetical protein
VCTREVTEKGRMDLVSKTASFTVVVAKTTHFERTWSE